MADPSGFAITTRFDVDPLGRTVAVHAPRSLGAPPGHFVTRTSYNELDQEILNTGSAPFGFSIRRFYDASGKLEREERDARDASGADHLLAGWSNVRLSRGTRRHDLCGPGALCIRP